MKIKNLPEAERPVEKTLRQGINYLSNSELLAVLLGTGTKDKSAIGLAEDVISFDSIGLGYLASATVEDLTKINGIGNSKAVRLLAAIELGKRVSKIPNEEKISIYDSANIAKLFMEELRYEKKEYFKVLLLNSKLEIISIETVSIGDLNSAMSGPREAFSMAIKRGAHAVIFVHNHPSGDPTPSKDDINATGILTNSGDILGIKVLDHIIIGGNRYTSIKEYLLGDTYKNEELKVSE